MVIVMAGFAAYVITKPYLPRLPFNKGDLISVGGVLGTVESITFVQTCLRTLDGKMVFFPNYKVMSDKVTNSSVLPNRRIDIDFFIPYDQDIEKVKRVVGDVLEKDKRVLEKPAPKVVIAQFSPNYLEMQARLWVQRKDALSCRWHLNSEIKSKFDEEGIVMASPRLEIRAKE
jgi:small conductance mechanosensitive channel